MTEGKPRNIKRAFLRALIGGIAGAIGAIIIIVGGCYFSKLLAYFEFETEVAFCNSQFSIAFAVAALGFIGVFICEFISVMTGKKFG